MDINKNPQFIKSLARRGETWRGKPVRKRKLRMIMGSFFLIAIVIFLVLKTMTKGNDHTDEFTYNPSELLESKDLADKLAQCRIIIDPGHGGYDPGCGEEGYYEKDLNLVLANKVRSYLEAQGLHVLLTREDDSAVSLEERVDIVNSSSADIFISIHHNSLDNDSITEGIETWYSDEANSLNKTLANNIQNEIIITTGAKDRGLKIGERLAVLKGATMPSCLIEVGFLSSHKERELLNESEYQDKIAQGIVSGLLKFCI